MCVVWCVVWSRANPHAHACDQTRSSKNEKSVCAEIVFLSLFFYSKMMDEYLPFYFSPNNSLVVHFFSPTHKTTKTLPDMRCIADKSVTFRFVVRYIILRTNKWTSLMIFALYNHRTEVQCDAIGFQHGKWNRRIWVRITTEEVCNHHHQGVSIVKIPLTLSTFIFTYLLDNIECPHRDGPMRVFASRPTLACPCMGVHGKTSLMSSYLLVWFVRWS